MKTNELRIGNYLNGKQGHVIVSEIRTNNSVKIHDNTSRFYVGICLIPIKITTEWLLKLGFEYNDNIGLYQNGGFDVDIEDDVYCHFYMNDYGDWYKYIEYVHQLQNLYFALTGEELTVEL
jgi:hypothetical protein